MINVIAFYKMIEIQIDSLIILNQYKAYVESISIIVTINIYA